MAHYVHGATTRRPATEADLANARHHNSQLAAELRQLEAIGERLQASIEDHRHRLEAERDAARKELSKAREQLTKTIREVDAVRLQSTRIRDVAEYLSHLPEPKYGGRAGLDAATEELAEYEARKKATGLVVELPRRVPNARAERERRHGTQTRYRDGCRCATCRTWKADSRHPQKAAA